MHAVDAITSDDGTWERFPYLSPHSTPVTARCDGSRPALSCTDMAL